MPRLDCDDFAARSLQTATAVAAADRVLADRKVTSAELVKRMCAVLDERLASGRQRALVICAYYKGVEILHICGGCVRSPSQAHWRPIHREDLFAVFSVSKGITAAALMALVSDGRIAYDTPASKVWPELGDGVGTVRDVASHRAGLQMLGLCLAVLAFPLTLGASVWPHIWRCMCWWVARASRHLPCRPAGQRHASCKRSAAAPPLCRPLVSAPLPAAAHSIAPCVMCPTRPPGFVLVPGGLTD